MQYKLIRNTSAYMLAAFLPPLASFFLLPIYTRYLPPAEFGILALAMTFSSLVQPFMGLQLIQSVRRMYFDYEGDALSRYISSVLFATLGINVALFGIIHAFGEPISHLLFPRADIAYQPYLLLALVRAFFLIMVNFFCLLLQVQERGPELLGVGAARAVLGAALGIYFVVFRHLQAEGLLAAQAATSALVAAGLALRFRRYLRPCVDFGVLRKALRFSLPLVPHTFSLVIFRHADRLLLGYFLSLETVGLYGIAQRISDVFSQAIFAFDRAVGPSFIKQSVADRERASAMYRRIVSKWSVYAGGVFLGLSVFSSEILHLLTAPEYHGAYTIVPILLGACVLRGLYQFSIKPLYAEKRTHVVPFVTITAGILNVTCNIVLIPRYGVAAAAWTILATMFVSFALAYRQSVRCYPLTFDWRSMVPVFGLVLGIFGVVWLVPVSNPLLAIALKAAGLAAFAAIVLGWDLCGVRSDLVDLCTWLRPKIPWGDRRRAG